MRQVGFHMLRHPLKFYKYIEQELLETGESYKSYCYNVYMGNVWGDDLVAAAFGDMWNLAISIVTPIFNKPLDLFHNKKKPDVVIIANGGCWTSENRSSTHFTATSLLDKHVKLPGSERSSTNPNVDTPPKLEPTILIDKTKAKQLGIQEYIKEEKVKTLQMLRSVTTTLNRMNSHIADLITESDEFIEQKKIMEYKLEKLGVSVEKIKEAGMLDERQFMRTENREQEDRERAAKRKREEEEKAEAENEAKKLRPIPVVQGKRRESFEDKEEKEKSEKEEKEYHDELEFVIKRGEQQKQIIHNQQVILMRQEKEMELKEMRLKQLLAEKEEQEKQKEKSEEEKAGGSSKIEETEKVTTSGRMRLENMIKPEYMKFFKTDKKLEAKPQEKEPQEEVKPEETNVYLPKHQPREQSVVLIQNPHRRTTNKRSGRTQPVHKDLHVGTRFYCDNCSSEFSRKDMLATHLKYDCLQTVRQFICDACNLDFYHENAVQEHYYKEHLKEDLWFCTRCGQGFAHKSRKSMHNKSGACPNKGGEEQFVGRAPYNEQLEATFKRRIQIPFEMTPVLQEPMPAEVTQVEHDPAEVTAQVEENPAEGSAQVEENPTEVAGQLEDDATALPPQVILPQTSGSSMDTSSILMDAGIEAGLVDPLQSGLSQQPRSAQEYITGGMDASQMLMSLASGGVGLNIKTENVGDDDDDDEAEKETEEVLELDIN